MVNIEFKNNEVVFNNPGLSQKVAFIVCLIVGIMLLPVGLLLLLVDEMRSVGFIITGFGLPFFTMAFHIKFIEKKPASFSFNNYQQEFVITEKNGFKMSIGYGDIQEFKIRKQAHSSSNSPATYTWIVYMQKKDGAFWDLYEFNKQQEGQDLLQKLNQNIPLSSSQNIITYQKLPDFILYKTNVDKTIFQWKDRQPLFTKITVFLVLSGIGFIIYGGITHNIKNIIANYIAVGLYSLIFILALYTAVKSINLYHYCEINKEKIIYGISRGNLNNYKVVKEMLLTKVKNTQFSFQFDHNIVDQSILIVDDQMALQMEKLKTGQIELGNIISIIKDIRNIFNLPMSGMLTAETVQFEQFLDYTLKQFKS